METKTITINVNAQAARAYESAPAERRRKLDALLSLKLSEVTQEARPLEEVMSDVSRKARDRGLTPEILKEIMDER